MKRCAYFMKRELILNRFENGEIDEHRLDVLLKRLDNYVSIVGIEPDDVEPDDVEPIFDFSDIPFYCMS